MRRLAWPGDDPGHGAVVAGEDHLLAACQPVDDFGQMALSLLYGECLMASPERSARDFTPTRCTAWEKQTFFRRGRRQRKNRRRRTVVRRRRSGYVRGPGGSDAGQLAPAGPTPGLGLDRDADVARLIVLGVGMRTHTGVARRMFGALASRGINIGMINTSEVRLTVVVDRARGEEALACLKEAFNVA